MTGNLTQQKYL